MFLHAESLPNEATLETIKWWGSSRFGNDFTLKTFKVDSSKVTSLVIYCKQIARL
jgi:hypothetical protein